jgi:hypothetical protein
MFIREVFIVLVRDREKTTAISITFSKTEKATTIPVIFSKKEGELQFLVSV